MSLIIAIDGYSSCGKSTVAKDAARELGYLYIDSGAMYRAVTLYCLRNNLIKNGSVDVTGLENQIDKIHIRFLPNSLTGKNDTFLNGENVEDEIRTPPVADMVSPVSVIGFVREAMVRLQREMGKDKGIVMDGRDIGTVVFPEAELKIFMTASPQIRAQRRYDELKAKGLNVSMEDIIKNIADRDRIDSTREISPLRQAEDALVLDNSHLTREEQLAWVLEKVATLKGA
ncbi:MAG: (d)CMP kinase [Bacteroidota bacterium]